MNPSKPYQTDVLSKHEEKFCPRCGTSFECKVGDVANCQCSVVRISPKTEEYLTRTFFDCLCKNCLKAVDEEINTSSASQFPIQK